MIKLNQKEIAILSYLNNSRRKYRTSYSISENVGIHIITLYKYLYKLWRLKLVKKIKYPYDKRVIIYKITNKGKRFI